MCCVLCVCVLCVVCVVCCVSVVGCWLLVVVVEWLYYSKRTIIERRTDLSDFSLIFVCKMCVFVSRPMNIVTFLREDDYTQNGLLIFIGKKTHSETQSWKSSRISTKKVTTTTVNRGNRRGFCV